MKRMSSDETVRPSAVFDDVVVWAAPPLEGVSIAVAIDTGAFSEVALTSLLSEAEVTSANTMIDTLERRHFLFRRSFQRVFVHKMLSGTVPIDRISMVHQRDVRPICESAPELTLSFSSSGTVAVACASGSQTVGVDIEKIRSIENAVELARRFFTSTEADFIDVLPRVEQSRAFLLHWTAKEAGLKALGKGIVDGLNSFVLKPQATGYAIHLQQKFEESQDWQLHNLNVLQDHIVAVVHRPVNNLRRH
jgi:phosphopantetheine--protein transferase-like protein